MSLEGCNGLLSHKNDTKRQKLELRLASGWGSSVMSPATSGTDLHSFNLLEIVKDEAGELAQLHFRTQIMVQVLSAGSKVPAHAQNFLSNVHGFTQ